MALTTRQVIALRNIAFALEQFYSDSDPYAGKFIPASWIDTINDRVALICEQCNGEGSVGSLRPDGWDSETCPSCNGVGLKLEVPHA